MPYGEGILSITVDWRRIKLGLETDVIVVYSQSIAGLPLIEEVWSSTFIVRLTTDYEASYSGVSQHVTAENSLPVEIEGRLSSAVLENLSAALSFNSVVTNTSFEATVPFLLHSITTGSSGGSTTAAQPGFQYCGGSCVCAKQQNETVQTNDCPTATDNASCSSKSCRVQPNSVHRDCNWIGAAGHPIVAILAMFAAAAAWRARRRLADRLHAPH